MAAIVADGCARTGMRLRGGRRKRMLEAMAERWFLKIDGIEGESTSSAHKGEIDVESWSWGLTNSGGGTGSGGGAGRASFADFQFVSRISKASPILFRSCATGTHHKAATLSGQRATRDKADFYTVKLSDVVVTGYAQSDSAVSVPSDSFSLNFAKIEVSYQPSSPSGKFVPPVTAGFDVRANKML